MAMDISNGNGEYMRFSHFDWAELLKLAYEYGWQPAETELGGWDGNYTSNDGQLITAEDADAIADALERAFDDSPDNRRIWGEELVDYFRAGALRTF